MVGNQHAWPVRGAIVVVLGFATQVGGCTGAPFSASDNDGGAPIDERDVSVPEDAPSRDAMHDGRDIPADITGDGDGAPPLVDATSRDVRSDAADGRPPVSDARASDAADGGPPLSDARASDAAAIDVAETGSPPDGSMPPRDAPSADAPTNEGGTTYPAIVLADGPLAYWRMGIRSGSTVPDESGHQNDLALKGGGHQLGAPGAIAGDGDTAIRFDGVSSYAAAVRPRDFDFPGGAPFTIECWARREPLADGGEGAYFQHLIGSSASGPPNRHGFLLYMLPTAVATSPYTAFEYDVPDGGQIGMQGPLAAGSTYGHYAATFDGTNAYLYVDGIMATSQPVNGSIGVRDSELVVGLEWSTGRYNFSGAIDEVAIYGKALSPVQIEKHRGAGVRR
jgi:hypothetical protein